MSEFLTFDSIKNEVENTYPTPLSSVFRKCRIAHEEDLGGRHKELIDLFEVLIKFLCVVELQEARQVFPNFRERLPQGGKTLEFLKRPSLGGWVGLLRMLNSIEFGRAAPFWMPAVNSWYNQGKTPHNMETLHLFDHVEGINYERKTKIPHAEICNALVTYRNKQLAHTANIYEEELLKRLPLLEHVLAYLLRSLDCLGRMKTVCTERIELTPHDSWQIHAVKLVGVNQEPDSFESPHKLELSEMYLVPEGRAVVDIRPVHLGPFFLWRTNETLKQPEVYLYNDAWRTKLEYISYQSGSYYYHKELHSDFKELLDIKLQPGLEEDVHRHLSQEQRAEQADNAFKRAMVFLEKRQFEDALECLELSAEYERRAHTFLEMAKIQHALGDPQDEVLQTLQNCLDLQPENAEALALQRALMSHTPEAHRSEYAQEDLPVLRLEERYPTCFHLLSPSFFRAYAPFFWLGAITLWFCASGFIEYLTGNPENILITVWQFLLGALIILCVTVGRRLFLRLRIPLSLQLDSMRLERFERWFHEQYRFIFGNIAFDGTAYRYNTTPFYERGFLAFSSGIAFAAAIAGFILCELHTVPVFFMVKRWLDNMIVVILLGFVIIRYIIASTLFIYQFSQLSLKPMLTKINDEGFRAFSPFIVSNLLFVMAGFVSYIIMATTEFTHPLKLDFIILLIGTLLYLTWSVGMPLMLRLAAKASKTKAVIAYSQHIEKAFDTFLQHPDQENLDAYNWLLTHQNVIQHIPTWPLSWKETLFAVIGSNLVLLPAVVWNVLVRTSHWDTFAEWASVLLGR